MNIKADLHVTYDCHMAGHCTFNLGTAVSVVFLSCLFHGNKLQKYSRSCS